jgi:molecular chaperone GrpE
MTHDQGTTQQNATEAQTTTEVPTRTEDRSNEVAELQQRVAELERQWRQSLADLDNLRKRVARDGQRMVEQERARLTEQWLPVVDNLELAIAHADADPATIVPGVKAVLSLATDLLARLGYPRDDDVGVPFDPTRHEAVSVVHASDVPEGTVVDVVRPGYGAEDRPLRPASVVVASRSD